LTKINENLVLKVWALGVCVIAMSWWFRVRCLVEA